MPTSGSIISFSQSLPFYSDSASISNVLSVSKYHSFSTDVVSAFKFYASAVTGVGEDNVRLSKERESSRRLRGFEKIKLDQKMETSWWKLFSSF